MLADLVKKAGEAISVTKYPDNFTCADSSLIRLVLLMHAEEIKKKKGEAAVAEDGEATVNTTVSDLTGTRVRGSGERNQRTKCGGDKGKAQGQTTDSAEDTENQTNNIRRQFYADLVKEAVTKWDTV